jgi:hypothetical protein
MAEKFNFDFVERNILNSIWLWLASQGLALAG